MMSSSRSPLGRRVVPGAGTFISREEMKPPGPVVNVEATKVKAKSQSEDSRTNVWLPASLRALEREGLQPHLGLFGVKTMGQWAVNGTRG